MTRPETVDRRSPVRMLLTIGIAILLGFCSFAIAAVGAHDASKPGLADRLWPSHPDIQIAASLRAIGSRAASGAEVDPTARAALNRVARIDPLAPEPFLLAGAVAQTAGDGAGAERLFEAARLRDPRSAAARYFLADRYLRTGRVDAGLGEVLAMSRLVPGSAEALVPSLASLAGSPEAVPALRRFIRQAPDYGRAILGTLATDADNADVLLKLAGNPPIPGDWQGRLSEALVERGEYARAHAVWRRLTGNRVGRGLFNANFAPMAVPPPFNWAFASSGGIVDSRPSGGVDIVFYGRDDVALASQTLVLRPGDYRLSMNVAGDREARGLSWRITCLPGGRTLFELPLRREADGRIQGQFTIPASCAGQLLQLRGAGGQPGGQVSVTIDDLRLDAETGS